MPLKYFICLEGNRVKVVDCLEQCSRDKGRCMAMGNLYAAADERVWNGVPSVTQLIKGTRQAYLEIVKDYAVSPDDKAFALLGVWHHRRLETINKKLSGLSEQKVGGEISGTLDRLEPDELYPGQYKLIDYKTAGGYSIAKALGLKGNGDPDMQEWELQLNYYRVLLEDDPVLGKLFPISRLFIQATVRDGGLKSTREMGVTRKMPLIPAQKLGDDFVRGYFTHKRDALMIALETGVLPPLCSFNERWANRRCKGGYCPVFLWCPEGAMMNRVELV